MLFHMIACQTFLSIILKSQVGQTLYMNDDKFDKEKGVKDYSLRKTTSFDTRDLTEKKYIQIHFKKWFWRVVTITL